MLDEPLRGGDEIVEDVLPEVPVDKNTPPAIFIHAGNDTITADGSAQMWLAMRRAGVHSELHIFPHGGHGYGLRPTKDPVTHWPKLVAEWMKRLEILKH